MDRAELLERELTRVARERDDLSRVSQHHKTAAMHASDRADALEQALSATGSIRGLHAMRTSRTMSRVG